MMAAPAKRTDRSEGTIATKRSDKTHRYSLQIDWDTHLSLVAELAADPPEIAQSAEDRWIDYLESLDTRLLASASVASAAKRLWARLRGTATTPPDASPSNSGGLLISWDRRGLHLEIEILSDTSYEWFFRQRSMDVSDGGDGYSVDEDIPEALRHRLNQIV